MLLPRHFQDPSLYLMLFVIRVLFSVPLGNEQVRPMAPLGPGVFQGVSWVFVLAPLTADRLEKGRAMLDAAEAAEVSGAILLSVIGAGEAAEATASSPLQLPGTCI